MCKATGAGSGLSSFELCAFYLQLIAKPRWGFAHLPVRNPEWGIPYSSHNLTQYSWGQKAGLIASELPKHAAM